MRRLVFYAAAAVAMSGTTAMTSQAAVSTYITGGSCGGWAGGNQGGCEGNYFSGGSYSVDQLLQMVTSSGSGSCGNGWGGGFTLPGGSGSQGDILAPDYDWSGCPGGSQGTGNPWTWCPDGQNPDCFYPGDSGSCGAPGCGDSGCQTPGTGNPGGGSGTDKPGTGGGTGTETPGTGGGTGGGTENPGTGGGAGTDKPGTGGGTDNPGTQVPDSDQAYIRQVIELVNEERAKRGLSPVTEDSGVSAAAAVRAQEITRSFSHTRPDGTSYNTVLNQSGVSYMGSGENIAYGQQTPAAVMNGWMNSQSHRDNILNGNYSKIGVGYYENAGGVKYWVQLFTY